MASRLIVYACLLAVSVPGVISAENMRRGIFQGTMVGFEGTASVGLLQAKTDEGMLQDCGYDVNSYFELNRERIPVTKLIAGDRLDIIVDQVIGTRACYMRIVHVLAAEPRSVRDTRKAASAPVSRSLLSLRPTRTIAGMVVGKEGNIATIRGRDGKDSMITLRPETSYFGDGVKMQASDLVANMRVSVQAGSTLSGSLEAVQIIWGSIAAGR
ncbi:MAG: hypothetical protein ABI824_01885 [Acidobacteriota bacterium]